MPSNRPPRRILYAELLSGRRHPGGLKKRFSDNMKLILKCCHIPPEPEQLNALASERQIWRAGCDSGISTSRDTRVQQKITVSVVIKRSPSPSLAYFFGPPCSSKEKNNHELYAKHPLKIMLPGLQTATALVRRLSASTGITVPTYGYHYSRPMTTEE